MPLHLKTITCHSLNLVFPVGSMQVEPPLSFLRLKLTEQAFLPTYSVRHHGGRCSAAAVAGTGGNHDSHLLWWQYQFYDPKEEQQWDIYGMVNILISFGVSYWILQVESNKVNTGAMPKPICCVYLEGMNLFWILNFFYFYLFDLNQN